MLDIAVSHHLIHDLRIHFVKESNIAFKVGIVFVFPEKGNGSVKQRLPHRLRMIVLADLDRIGEDISNFNVRLHLLFVSTSVRQNFVDSLCRNLHRFLNVTHSFIQVFHTVEDFPLLADLETLLHWKGGMLLKRLQQFSWLKLAHSLNKFGDGLVA